MPSRGAKNTSHESQWRMWHYGQPLNKQSSVNIDRESNDVVEDIHRYKEYVTTSCISYSPKLLVLTSQLTFKQYGQERLWATVK